MKLQYLRAFIVLVAGLITLIINMKMGRSNTVSLLVLLIVLIIFYFLGTLAVELIQHSMNKLEEEPDEEEEEQPLEEESEDTVSIPFDEDEEG
ncbi:MAG: hypothetical protein NC300_01250 [Bacteroidales bacterium]|nr:hypothetical protein [Clostridium sp.]MCM1202751.1 hypothetical protein [Bacteroidales bacterium]